MRIAQADSRRVAYSVLERRATAGVLGVLLSLATVGWWYTAKMSSGMSMMVQGLASVGHGMPFDMEAPLFLAMWTAMMVAMMFPAIAPIVLLHRMVLRKQGSGTRANAAFVVGYLAVWAATGAVPLAALWAFRSVSAESLWVPRLAGAVLVVAGLYQFSPWKDTCLRACRNPLNFLMTHKFGGNSRAAFRTGATHGLYCLGCCWALMTVLFVVGLMNLVWMAGITAVFVAEKNWKWGDQLIRVVGIGVAAFGVAALVHPGLLSTVAAVPTASTQMSM